MQSVPADVKPETKNFTIHQLKFLNRSQADDADFHVALDWGVGTLQRACRGSRIHCRCCWLAFEPVAVCQYTSTRTPTLTVAD
jgi:hypothetical protein